MCDINTANTNYILSKWRRNILDKERFKTQLPVIKKNIEENVEKGLFSVYLVSNFTVTPGLYRMIKDYFKPLGYKVSYWDNEIIIKW